MTLSIVNEDPNEAGSCLSNSNFVLALKERKKSSQGARPLLTNEMDGECDEQAELLYESQFSFEEEEKKPDLTLVQEESKPVLKVSISNNSHSTASKSSFGNQHTSQGDITVLLSIKDNYFLL